MLSRLLAVFLNWWEDRYGAVPERGAGSHASRRIEPTLSYSRHGEQAAFQAGEPPLAFRRSRRA